MNQFVRLGNIILNLAHVIEVRLCNDDLVHRYDGTPDREATALYITTTEMAVGDYGGQSRTIRFLDDDAVQVWDFLCDILDKTDRKTMRFLDVTTS